MADRSTANRPKQYTCLACHVSFHTADHQRDHYKTDWHRYNLKRKVAQLPPVTAENFAERLLAQQAKTQQAQQVYSQHCGVCSKTYNSENAYQAHLKSKKHLQAAAATAAPATRKSQRLQQQQQQQQRQQQMMDDDGMQVDFMEEENVSKEDAMEGVQDASMAMRQRLKEDSLKAREFQRRLLSASSESQVMAILEEKKQSAMRLSVDQDCLFCAHQSSDLEGNLQHMTVEHSFFLPDVEFLVDVRGFLRYLGEKVSVMNMCLHCDDKGRGFQSLEAVRKHMTDKGHTKVLYDTQQDQDEYAEYYDFSSTWKDGQEQDVDMKDATRGLHMEDLELVLPNGTRLGHRSMMRYYKQRLRSNEGDEDAEEEEEQPSDDGMEESRRITGQLASRYREMGITLRSRQQERGAAGSMTTTSEHGRFRAPPVTAVDRANDRHRQDRRTARELRVGMKGNNQQHFRAQVDF